MTLTLHPKAAYQVRNVVEAGERLHWAGMPRQGWIIRDRTAFICWTVVLFVAIIFGSGSGEDSADRIDDLLSLGPPFLLIALCVSIGPFAIGRIRRRRVFYGLTNRRSIVISGLLFKSVTAIRLRAVSMVNLDERDAGQGSIHLCAPREKQPPWRGILRLPPKQQDQFLELIPDARPVHDRIMALILASD